MNIQELEKFSPYKFYYDVKDQLKRHIYKRSEEAFYAGDAARDAITTMDALAARQRDMREKFIESLGGIPASDTPLDAKVTGVVECDGYRIEKVIFQSRPNIYVTANLYVPDGITSPRGAVLFVCGHAMDAKHCDGYQTVSRYLVDAGLVVLIQDPVGQGERFSYYEKSIDRTTVQWGTREHDYAGGQCLPMGDAIARYFVHDAMRGVDYLISRPEVDPEKIGVTGSSGGGTQTCLMMMCDPRIAAAAPGTFFMNRETYMHAGGAQDAEQIWPGMTAAGWDHEDLLLMMVPRPVMILAVNYDFFPIEGTRRSVERCERFWDMAGCPGNLELTEDPVTHSYSRPLARAAAEFFSKRLLGEKVTPSPEGKDPIEPSKLWCTTSGQVRGEIEGARFVYDENLERLPQIDKLRESLGANERKTRAIEWLKQKVMSGRKPTDLCIRRYLVEPAGEFDTSMFLWWSQEGVFNHAYVFRSYKRIGEDLPVTVAVWDDGTNIIRPHLEWIRKTCDSGRAAMVLDTSGVGALEPNDLSASDLHDFYGTIHKFNDDLIWLDDSIAALRTYDVIRALDMIAEAPELDAGDTHFYAFGRQGIYARLAAAIDDRVKNIEVVGGIKSVADWVKSRHYDYYRSRSVVIPGMLKYFDLPDLE